MCKGEKCPAIAAMQQSDNLLLTEKQFREEDSIKEEQIRRREAAISGKLPLDEDDEQFHPLRVVYFMWTKSVIEPALG